MAEVGEVRIMRTPKITRYELACGCTAGSIKDGISVNLWMEHGAYHVRVHDHNGAGRLAWEVFPGVTLARESFRRMVRQYHRKGKS